ncbi:MAG: hypothetical protein WCA77_05660 [Thermoplasmata archaeon]
MQTDQRDGEMMGRLDDRVIDVLIDHQGTIAFNGLKRALNAHPESLARALRRLERDGLVRRGPTGYMAVGDRPTGTIPGRDEPTRSLVASVELVPGTTASAVLGGLVGRWFGQLRWVGIHERPGEPTLVWSVEDGSGHVMLSVHGRMLRVYVDRLHGDARRSAVERAAHDMLRFALERLPRFAPSAPAQGGVVPFAASAPSVWVN